MRYFFNRIDAPPVKLFDVVNNNAEMNFYDQLITHTHTHIYIYIYVSFIYIYISMHTYMYIYIYISCLQSTNMYVRHFKSNFMSFYVSNRHPPKILPTIYPSADLPSIFIKHFTNKVEKLRANVASEHVTSTLV